MEHFKQKKASKSLLETWRRSRKWTKNSNNFVIVRQRDLYLPSFNTVTEITVRTENAQPDI